MLITAQNKTIDGRHTICYVTFFIFCSLSLSLCLSLPPEAAVGAHARPQPLPAAVAGRGSAGRDHPPHTLLPPARPHRVSERADRLPGGAAGHL